MHCHLMLHFLKFSQYLGPKHDSETTMKRMTCRQLGGACETEFFAETFEEMAEKSKQHGMAMFQAKDAAHIAAMESMKALMVDPSGMQKWMNSKRAEFLKLTDE
jgi:hypothetical protein